MKRHPHLQPLSRQHHLGLSLATKAKQCTDTPSDIQAHWHALTAYLDEQTHKHFAIEEAYIAKVLLAKLTNPQQPTQITAHNLAKELMTQHEALHRLTQLTNPTADDVINLANALYEHIRFEEREVFPLAQELLSESELLAIYKASDDKAKIPNTNR